MIKISLCDNCPDNIRGKCCYFNVVLEGYNVILSNQKCKYLNKETGRCTIYNDKKRNKIPYCMKDKDMFGHGGLPRGCLYLKGNEDLEPNPKLDIKEVVDKLSPKSIGLYNMLNNIENIERFAIIP